MDVDEVRFEANAPFVLDHVERLLASYRRWTGRQLLPPEMHLIDAQGALYDAPFALVSHGAEPDPIFNYANLLAQQLFEMAWDEFVRAPSRLTAAPEAQAERQRLLAEVGARGYVENYAGVRVAKSGRRFEIRDTTIWNVVDEAGSYHGQAAMIRQWDYVR